MDFDNRSASEFLAQQRPELWRRCYPRIYEEPNCGKYYSAKEVSYQLLGTAVRVEHETMLGQSQIAELVWTSRLANLRVPIYWIGHDMAQAIQQTVPPIEFDWANTKLPFDAMTFMMPKGVLQHDDPAEGDALFVSFVRVKTGDEIPSLAKDGPQVFHIMEDAFSCFATTQGEALMHWTYAVDQKLNKQGRVNLAELDNLVQDFSQHKHSTYSMFSSELTMKDNYFMARVSHFVFGTLLLMLTKPEHVTPAALQKRVASKGGGAPKEFWRPNVVGLNYHIKQESQGGTHASPRLHWVRGAYKEQPYGEKHALRKRIWIEPYLRGDNQ